MRYFCLPLLLLAYAALVTPNAAAETAYISDKLTVPLRSGPSNGHRIVHQGLPAGTKMEIQQEDPGGVFVEIVTARGTKGWIRKQYLTSQPIARDRLRAAQAEITRLQGTLNTQKSSLAELRKQSQASTDNSSRLGKELQDATKELERIKGISKNAIAEHAENQRLQELNARLRDELEDLTDDRDRLRSNVQQRWLMIGGGLVFAGLLLGVLLKSRPRRSAWT